ncbi:hypothetical protein O9929_23755 [Vibrio lentus]|nr:hypothetical protein [Vibrio lentus]
MTSTMISRATKYVEKGVCLSLGNIMIDEYQDIPPDRLAWLKPV